MDEAHSQSFSLRGHMLEEIRILAQERGESMSFIVREALRSYIDQQRRARPSGPETGKNATSS